MAGLFVIGVDYEPGETSPYDLSFDWAIKLSGPGFVGKAACRAAAEHPARRCATLAIDGDLPEPGTLVTRDGDVVGVVKSPVASPHYGVIALAAVDTAVAAERGEVRVGESSATIHGLPLYDPDKQRPRS